jgi:hypothetical protein
MEAHKTHSSTKGPLHGFIPCDSPFASWLEPKTSGFSMPLEYSLFSSAQE